MAKQEAKTTPDVDLDRLIWGAEAIAEAANLRDRRQAWDLLERKVIPARKAGKLWVTTLRQIRSIAEVPPRR